MPARHRLRLTIAAVAIAAASMSGVAACSSDGGIEHLAASDFANSIATSGTVVIDVRTPAEYAAGHLPDALNLDVNAADFDTKITSLDKSRHYALYCHSGRRSGIAAQKMHDAGFTDVVDLAGGIETWTGAVVTG